MKRLHIVGRKNAGKTTLIEELVRWYSAHGYRVGTVKHTHHHHELDTPGKDSFRHREAGAAVVAVLAPSMTAVFRPVSGEPAQTRYDVLAELMLDCELILVEGDSQTSASKVEVWRAAVNQPPLSTSDRRILALISDDAVDVPISIWPRSDLEQFAPRLLELADD